MSKVNKDKTKKNYKQIIWDELKIWKTAYPRQAKLLEKFAIKIKLELELQGAIK